MIYKFDDRVVNKKSINGFFDKDNFVGYILPDGTIYQCKEHNISNVDAVLDMYLQLLSVHFEERDKILNNETKDKILKMVINYLSKASYMEIVAFKQFKEEHNLFISDILVQFFRCHMITRLDRTILTSEANHECFYNYLLNGFSIQTIDRIIYNREKEKYEYVSAMNRNDYLNDEIMSIKNSVSDSNLELFYK